MKRKGRRWDVDVKRKVEIIRRGRDEEGRMAKERRGRE